MESIGTLTARDYPRICGGTGTTRGSSSRGKGNGRAHAVLIEIWINGTNPRISYNTTHDEYMNIATIPTIWRKHPEVFTWENIRIGMIGCSIGATPTRPR